MRSCERLTYMLVGLGSRGCETRTMQIETADRNEALVMTEKELLEMAVTARQNAYAPYSQCYVGAALECADGSIFTGCNIENAAFGPSNCAERTAIFKAVSEGHRDFVRIAVVGGRGEKIAGNYPPCGVCRQVLREFCPDPETLTILLGTPEQIRRTTLSELLPDSFGPENVSD